LGNKRKSEEENEMKEQKGDDERPDRALDVKAQRE
jgi:hypothetical protein